MKQCWPLYLIFKLKDKCLAAWCQRFPAWISFPGRRAAKRQSDSGKLRLHEPNGSTSGPRHGGASFPSERWVFLILRSDPTFNRFQTWAFLRRSDVSFFPPSRRFVRAAEDRALLHPPGAPRRHEASGFWQHGQRAGGPVTDGVQATRTAAREEGEGVGGGVDFWEAMPRRVKVSHNASAALGATRNWLQIRIPLNSRDSKDVNLSWN